MGTYELEHITECMRTRYDDRYAGELAQIIENSLTSGYKYEYPRGYAYRIISYNFKHPEGLGINEIKKVTVRMSIKKHAGEGRIIAGPIEDGSTSEDSVERRWYASGRGYPIINKNVDSDVITKEITDSTHIKNLFTDRRGFGIKGSLPEQETSVNDYVEYSDIKFIAEYKDKYTAPKLSLRNDLMGNGGFYTEENRFDYYQFVDKPFSISWDYSQEAGAAIANTKIEVKTLSTADGTNEQEWFVEGYTYSGNTGTVVIPDYIWKRVPCSGWVKITVTSETGVSASLQFGFDVPFHRTVILRPEKDSILKFETNNKLEWEIQDLSDFVAYPSVSGYQIYLSTNEGATYDLIAEITGDRREYVFGAETLPIGILYVRVVAMYDNNKVAQNYQYGESRYIIGADPETSTVTCDGKPIPTVSWVSVAQSSYQVRFGDYDSGAVYSEQKSHKVPYIYENGVYKVSVRTQIATGEWSDWSEPIYVQITNVPPGFGVASVAENSGYRIKVTWTKNQGYQDYVVYRDGVPIHITDGGISTEGGYMDSMANGISVYYVRGITADGYYDQSADMAVNAAVKTDIIFELGTDEILPLKYTPSFPRKYNYSGDMPVTYRWFAGRQKPIAISSGQISKALPLSYIDKGRTLAKKLMGYIGKTVVFKDTGGDMIVGILNTVNAGMGHVSTTSFQITEVDYNERVEYIQGE